MDEKTSLPPSFDALIRESEKPILVDFYADWCGPCKMVSPVIRKLAGEYKGRILTVKVDTEKKQNLARQYDITGIPTIMLFHKGQVLMRLTGAHPYANLKLELEKALASAPR
jgi:thioredoxin 1